MTQFVERSEKVKVLFMAASPENECRLLLDDEISEITQKVLAITYKDLLIFHQIWATRPSDVL